MAVITVFVAGVDRSELVDRTTGLGYTNDINGMGQAQLTLADVPSGFVPTHGQEVLIKEDAVDVFGGTIQTRPRQFHGPDSANQLTFYEITAASWEQRLNKRRVWRAYNQVAFEDIVADLNTDFLSGEGITLDVLAGTPISITFNGESVAEAMDLLCSQETDGRTWYVTPAKVLTVNVSTATPAPATLNSGNLELNNPEPSIEPDDTGYANTITVVGGNPELPILFTDEDAAEIAARAAAEGGSGIHHDTVEDNELVTALQVQQRAEGLLLQRKQIRQRFVGMTNVQGFAIGQEVLVELPNLGITGPKPFFIVGIETQVAPGPTELWHTITAVDGPLDGTWQSEYRRKIAPKTIPMQIEATPGLVRVEPTPGVLIHDPPPVPAEWFQAAPSGTMPFTPNACQPTHQAHGQVGGFLWTIRRGGGANTDGCGGGTFPGFGGSPACFVNRQGIVEGYAIDADGLIAQVATAGTNWDELEAGSYKSNIMVNEDNTLLAFIERDGGGGDPVLGIVDLVGGGLAGSVAAVGMVDNNTGFEAAWVGDFLYIPEGTAGGSIFVFDVSTPSAPTLETEFNTTATGTLSSCVPNAAGTALYTVETGGSQLFIVLNITDPTAITEADTQVATGDYVSLDIDEQGSFADPQLIAFHKADASNIRAAELPLTDAHTFGTLTESLVPLVISGLMEGWTTLYFTDSAITYANRLPGNANTQEAHVFNVDPVGGVTFVETLTFTHPTGGNLNQARTYIGNQVGNWFGFTVNAQMVYGLGGFDKIVPYEIEEELRTDFGGTGVDGANIQKGDLLVGEGSSDPFLLLPSIGAAEGATFRKRSAEASGLAWEDGAILAQQVAIDNTDSPYTVPTGVTVILADASAGAITVNLPNVADELERMIIVKNDGDGSNDVTVDPFGIETIDGDPTRVLSQDQVLGVTGSVNEWEVILGANGGAGGTLLRGYIDGLTTLLAGDADHDVTTCPGIASAVLSGDDEMVTLVEAITKQIDATWAEGNDLGGLFSGTVAADTEYNLIVITKDADGTVDAGFDTSPKGANTPSGWTARRRIGSVFTDASSNIRGYIQQGDYFRYLNPVADITDVTGSSGVFETGSVSIPAASLLHFYTTAAAGSPVFLGVQVRTPGSSDGGADETHLLGNDSNNTINTSAVVLVDGSSQVEYSLLTDGTVLDFKVRTIGWWDERGRNAKPGDEEMSMIRIDYQELLENGSGVAKQLAQATMNLDACGFRFGAVQDRAYLAVKLPEAWVGQELHMVGVFSNPITVVAGSEMLKLEIGFDSWDNDGVIPGLGVINDGTAANEVDIDHAWPLPQYTTQALELAVWTPSATERHFIARITRDGTEETSDGNRLAANLSCMEVYIVPVAEDVGGYIVGDTVV